MTVAFKKAGEAVAKKAVAAVSKDAGAAAKAAATTQVPLKVQRAVTAEESPGIKPARESSKSTMMPWKGWVGSMIRDKLGEDYYKKYRETIFYEPDDDHDLHQMYTPTTKINISKDDPSKTAMFRHPSPGSQDPVNIPTHDLGTDPFDAGFYKKDTGRRYTGDYAYPNQNLEKIKLELMPKDDPDVEELAKEIEAGPQSSPGNKGRFATGPTDFDPTGLRASMSANWPELEKSLDAHMPDHVRCDYMMCCAV